MSLLAQSLEDGLGKTRERHESIKMTVVDLAKELIRALTREFDSRNCVQKEGHKIEFYPGAHRSKKSVDGHPDSVNLGHEVFAVQSAHRAYVLDETGSTFLIRVPGSEVLLPSIVVPLGIEGEPQPGGKRKSKYLVISVWEVVLSVGI